MDHARWSVGHFETGPRTATRLSLEGLLFCSSVSRGARQPTQAESIGLLLKGGGGSRVGGWMVWDPPIRDALEGKGPQRRPQRRLDRRLEEVAEAVWGGYCRLKMPLKLALAVRETVAGHRLGAREEGGGGFQCIPVPHPPPSGAEVLKGTLGIHPASTLRSRPTRTHPLHSVAPSSASRPVWPVPVLPIPQAIHLSSPCGPGAAAVRQRCANRLAPMDREHTYAGKAA